ILIMLLVIFLTYKDYKNKRRNRGLDFSILFITGIIGILLFLLWYATDHTMTKNNFNILWAFPLNLFVSFFILKKELKKWVVKYIFFILFLIGVTLIFWIFKIQVFPIV